MNGFQYFDNFISPEDEIKLVEFIDSKPWNTSLKRRTQHYGKLYKYKNMNTSKDVNEYDVNPVPENFIELFDKIKELMKLKIDISPSSLQVIVNEYEIGTGISKHVDDPVQFGEFVCGVSLLSSCEMTFTNTNDSKDIHNIFLKRRSLYILTERSRYNYFHEIKNRKKDGGISRSKRISITFRNTK